MAVKDWSSTAGSNIQANTGINWDEGMNAASVNDSARATMAQIASWYAQIKAGTIYSGTVGGTASAITLTCSPTIDAYAAGQRFMFKAASDCSGATTLNVDTLGAKNIYYAQAALAANAFKSGDLVIVAYDGTQFQFLSSQRPVVSASDIGSGTLSDSRLSSNVVLENAANAFTSTNSFSQAPTFATALAITSGGTGATSASGARTGLGLGSIATKALNVSTASPSGTPADGDIWLKRAT